MPEIADPRELFLHELADILYVERSLVSETLPQLINEVHDDEFRTGLERHLEQTRRHVTNVEKVFQQMGEPARAETCVGFEGLKNEHQQLTQKSAPNLVDLIDLGAAARTENYEIAAYESLRRSAKGMGEERAVKLLDQNLRDEKDALRGIEKITTRLTKAGATSG